MDYRTGKRKSRYLTHKRYLANYMPYIVNYIVKGIHYISEIKKRNALESVWLYSPAEAAGHYQVGHHRL